MAQHNCRDNYEEWSLCLKNFLLSQDVWDVIEAAGTDDDQQAGHDHEVEFKAWRRKNATALLAIQITCEPLVFSEIKKAELAKDAWDALATSYGASSASIITAGDDDVLNVLVKYAHADDWASMEDYLKRVNPSALTETFGSDGLTALHVATKVGNEKFVKKLVDLMPGDAIAKQEKRYGLTALHYAAVGGNLTMAESIIENHPESVEIANNLWNLPITQACFYNRREMSDYLLSKTRWEVLEKENGKYGSKFLAACIRSQMLDVAVKALNVRPTLVEAKYPWSDHINALLWSLSKTPEIFPSRGCGDQYWQQWIYKCIPAAILTSNAVIQHQSQWLCKMRGAFRNFLKFLGITNILHLKTTHAYSFALLDHVSRHLKPLTANDCYKPGMERAFDRAVKFGIVEIITMLIEFCPLLMDRLDQDGRNVIMQSIVNRHEKVFNLYYGLKGLCGVQTIYVSDKLGNTVLHLAGMLSPPSVLARIPGAALQMQRELQWYKQVESIVDPAAKSRVNKDQKTPDQVFSESHKELVKAGEKWMKDTAKSYTVVGALIITVMFTAVFTVPGDYIQDLGIPVFLHKKAFKAFIVSDAISLFAASTSVLMFLGILTSRYAEQDFLKSLPTKLIIGNSMLFISIAAMMVAFCSALIVTLCGLLNIIILIVVIACIPVILFMFLQFSLLADVFMSTYGPSIFNKKRTRHIDHSVLH